MRRILLFAIIFTKILVPCSMGQTPRDIETIDRYKNYIDKEINANKQKESELRKKESELRREVLKRESLERQNEQLKGKNRVLYELSRASLAPVNCYEEFMKAGIDSFDQQLFIAAINQFEAAKRCDDFSKLDGQSSDRKKAQRWVALAIEGINNQKKQAEYEKMAADSARRAVEQADIRFNKYVRGARNIDLLISTQETDPTLAFRIAQYNIWRHPENTSSSLLFDQLALDTTNIFYRSVLKKHKFSMKSVAFFPDSNWVTSGDGNNGLLLIDITDGKEIRRFDGHTKRISSVSFSCDGSMLLTGSLDSTARIWDVATGTCLQVLNRHKNDISSVVFSKDGQNALIGSGDGVASLWNIKSKKLIDTFSIDHKPIYGVDMSPDKSWIVLTGSNKVAHLYDTKNKVEVTKIEAVFWDKEYHFRAPRPRNDLLIEHTIDPYNESIRDILGSNMFCPIAISHDSKNIFSASANHVVMMWDAQTGKKIHNFYGHTDAVFSISLSQDGKKLLSTSKDNTIRVWNIETGQSILVLKNGKLDVYAAAIHPNDEKICTVDETRSVKTWDIGPHKIFPKKDKDDDIDVPYAYVLFPNGDKVLMGGDDSLSIFDLDNDTLISRWFGHEGSVPVVSISQDEKIAISGSDDGTAKIWDLETGENTFEMEEHPSGVEFVAVSNATKTAATAVDSTIWVWDIEKKELLYTLKELGESVVMNFSSDGKMLITGSENGDAMIWDVSTGSKKSVLPHQAALTCVAFFKDTLLAVTCGSDYMMKLWDLRKGKIVKTFPFFSESLVRHIISEGSQLYTIGGFFSIQAWDLETDCLEYRIYEYPLSVLHDNGVELEPDDLLTLWGEGKKLEPEELRLIHKQTNK